VTDPLSPRCAGTPLNGVSDPRQHHFHLARGPVDPCFEGVAARQMVPSQGSSCQTATRSRAHRTPHVPRRGRPHNRRYVRVAFWSVEADGGTRTRDRAHSCDPSSDSPAGLIAANSAKSNRPRRTDHASAAAQPARRQALERPRSRLGPGRQTTGGDDDQPADDGNRPRSAFDADPQPTRRTRSRMIGYALQLLSGCVQRV